MHKFSPKSPTGKSDLVETLRGGIAAGEGFALVAEVDGQVVGQVMFTRSLLDAPRRLVEVQARDPSLPAPVQDGPSLRAIVWGADTEQALDTRASGLKIAVA
jgi:hypothetical protein